MLFKTSFEDRCVFRLTIFLVADFILLTAWVMAIEKMWHVMGMMIVLFPAIHLTFLSENLSNWRLPYIRDSDFSHIDYLVVFGWLVLYMYYPTESIIFGTLQAIYFFRHYWVVDNGLYIHIKKEVKWPIRK